MKNACLAGVTLALVGHIASWGAVGHETVGYIAMEFLTTKAAAFVRNKIPAAYNNSLGLPLLGPIMFLVVVQLVRTIPHYRCQR